MPYFSDMVKPHLVESLGRSVFLSWKHCCKPNKRSCFKSLRTWCALPHLATSEFSWPTYAGGGWNLVTWALCQLGSCTALSRLHSCCLLWGFYFVFKYGFSDWNQFQCKKKMPAPAALNKTCMLKACIAALEYMIPWRVKRIFRFKVLLCKSVVFCSAFALTQPVMVLLPCFIFSFQIYIFSDNLISKLYLHS